MYGAVKRDFDLSKIGMNTKELQTYGYQRRPSHKDLSFVACTTSLSPSSSFTAIPQRTLGPEVLRQSKHRSSRSFHYSITPAGCFHSSFSRSVPFSLLNLGPRATCDIRSSSVNHIDRFNPTAPTPNMTILPHLRPLALNLQQIPTRSSASLRLTHQHGTAIHPQP